MTANNFCECKDCLAKRDKEIKGTGDIQKRPFVSTTKPLPPEEKKKILTTQDLPADLPTQRYWDKEKTLRKPAFVTSDIENPEDIERKKKTNEILAARKEKEKK